MDMTDDRRMPNDGILFRLLRAAISDETFDEPMTADRWRQVYAEAWRQSVLGVTYRVVCQLAIPIDMVAQWASEAEAIRGLNKLMNQEAARLTQLFAEAGRQSVILKGQANARLYPDVLSRQPGDIDIWVSGGRKSVKALLKEMGLLAEEATTSYHHVHLPANENGVTVEVHFRPSSGNFNPITNRRLQRWLETELASVAVTDEGFNVPSMRFALVMQLAHIQRHFFSEGIGLRQVCDYYWLLHHSTDDDRQTVASVLDKFGLSHAAGALMWMLGQVLRLDTRLMLCAADSQRGEWMLNEVMSGGNFGQYAERQRHRVWRRVYEKKRRQLRLMRFDFQEVIWQEMKYWVNIVQTLPIRIKYGKLSLKDFPR